MIFGQLSQANTYLPLPSPTAKIPGFCHLMKEEIEAKHFLNTLLQFWGTKTAPAESHASSDRSRCVRFTTNLSPIGFLCVRGVKFLFFLLHPPGFLSTLAFLMTFRSKKKKVEIFLPYAIQRWLPLFFFLYIFFPLHSVLGLFSPFFPLFICFQSINSNNYFAELKGFGPLVFKDFF